MPSWFDEGMTLQIDASTEGDFVKLGTATEYPFVAGGGGIPTGWTQYLGTNVGGSPAASDVSWTTSYGRFSIGNLGTTTHHGNLYGIYRDFTINPNKRWLIQVQARTTQNRTAAIRYVQWITPAGSGSTYLSQVWSYDDWEQVSMYSGVRSHSSMRVYLIAAPYEVSKEQSGHDPVDANWGIQFQNVTLVEMESTYPDPTWKSITCDVHSLGIHYGRDKYLSRYDVGTAQLSLLNDDAEYMYGLTEWMRPGRFLRIKGTRPGNAGGGPYSMYYGIIDGIVNGFTLDGRSIVTFSCVDVSSLLANVDVPTYSDQFETFQSGIRFRNLAYAAGWHPQYINYDNGKFIQQAILANGRSVRDELGLIADSEGSYFYADKTGRLFYRDREWNLTDSNMNTVQAELLATPTTDNLPIVDQIPTSTNVKIIPLKSIDTEWSRDRVVNLVSMANAGGTAVITNDFDSQRDYGPRTYQRHDLLNDNAHPEYLTTRTADVMTGYADAILRVNNVTFDPVPDNYHFALLSFLNWLVRVRYEHPTEGWGFAVVTHIQGITHTLTPHGWTCALTLDQPEAFTYYVQSTGGWDDALWDWDMWDGLTWVDSGVWNSGHKWNDPLVKWAPNAFVGSLWSSGMKWDDPASDWGR